MTNDNKSDLCRVTKAIASGDTIYKTGANKNCESVTKGIANVVNEEVTVLKSALNNISNRVEDLNTTVNGMHVSIEYIPNEYVGNDGTFKPYANWSRTNFIPAPNDGDGLRYTNSAVASAYCAFYASQDESSFIRSFSIQHTQTGNFPVPENARYFAVSNYTAFIRSFVYLNPPTSEGLVDDINKILETPKVVMSYKLVALEGEQFDVYYDNIFVNYKGKDIPYKEVFGSFYGIGMDGLLRLQSDVVGTATGAIRYRNSIPSAYNSPTLPEDVLRQSFAIQTIAKSSGSGVTRKVILIGDSWTAPGLYARELRSLFESEDEPMNITLMGTLGNGGAYVGPENGYHEGHGAYSAKSFCTVATKNGYANAFFNPTSQTFDFSYYMNNCGYSSVDDVFINLGINDVAEVKDFEESIGYWNTMINSIKSYNANIKVFIGLCGLPAQYEYGINNNNCNRSKARRLLFHERLIAEYGDRENEGIIIVPLHLSIDSEHDFPVTQTARSFRDSTLVDYCTDYVHPTIIAYNKVADRIRTYIKYAETI